MNKHHCRLLSTLMLAICLNLQPAGAASLNTFGAASMAFDVTADGRMVAGSSGGANFVWTAAGGMNLGIGGIAPGGSTTGGYSQLSADGSRLLAIGLNGATGKYEPAIYNFASASWTLLGSNGGSSGLNSGSAYDMTPDGRYVVGASYTGAAASTFHATVWDTVAGTRTNIANGIQSRINSVSNDGAVAVGYSTSGQTSSVWVRQADGSYLQSAIIRPGGSAPLNITLAVSGNGLWAAGASFNTALPYYYNFSTGVATYFPKLPYLSANLRSVASPSAISDDGGTIIGTHSVLGTLNTNHGFLWHAGLGLMEIDDYFADVGVDPTNEYDFVSPITMKTLDDGSLGILGIARRNGDGAMVGFMATVPAPVPEPASALMLLAGLLWLARLKPQPRDRR